MDERDIITNLFESELNSQEINGVATEFSGASERGDIANAAELQPGTNDFSFLFRLTQKVLAGNKGIFGFSNSGGTLKLVVGWDNGKPYFSWIDTGSGETFTTTFGTQFTDLDKYFTVGMTGDRDGNFKIFVNASLDVTKDFSPAVAFDMSFSEGLNIGGIVNDVFHEGLIDEFIYWNGVAMSDTEMQGSLYNDGFAIDPKKKAFYDVDANQIKKTKGVSFGGFLAAHYKMGDDDTFPFIRDHSGDDHNAKLKNMAANDFVNIVSPN